MSANNFAVADRDSESFPDYGAKIHDHYIEGYEPVSLGAPHSSLERTSTWVGMGLVLVGLAGVGLLIFGFATSLYGTGSATEQDPTMYMIIGAITAVVIEVIGFALIYRGRRYYRAYVKETGRKN